MKQTNEIIQTINRCFALFMTEEDLNDYELTKLQEAQIILNRHKQIGQVNVLVGTEKSQDEQS